MKFALGDNLNESYPLILHITQHQSGRVIEDYVAKGYQDEEEVVFPRNTRFQVYRREEREIDYQGRLLPIVRIWLVEIIEVLE